MLLCGGCRQAFYCSRRFQRKDWKHHRNLCKHTVARESVKKNQDPDRNAVDLSVTVRLLSGDSRTMEGFKYDNPTSFLEERVLDWASHLVGLDAAFIVVKLMFQDSELDATQTFSESRLCDGAEVTAIVERDEPPPLVDSSDND